MNQLHGRRVTATFLADPTPPSLTAIPELLELGKTLQGAREALGLSIAELASRLNMGREQLEALESGERQRLPEPVFVIAQARRVSGALKVDVNQQIESLRRNPQFVAAAPPTYASNATNASNATSRASNVTSATSGGLPTARLGSSGSKQLAPQNPSPGQRHQQRSWAGPLLVALGLAAVGLVVGVRSGWRAPQLKSPLPALPRPQGPHAATLAEAEQLQTAAGPGQSLRASQGDPTDKLVFVSSGISWLEVQSVGGQSLFRGNFSGERSFPVGQGLRVLAGRPDLVTVRLGKGQPQQFGSIDQVTWRSFMVPAPAGSAPGPLKPPAHRSADSSAPN